MKISQEYLLDLLITKVIPHALTIILILIGVAAAFKFIRMVGEKIIHYTEDDDRLSVSEREKRAQTLVNIISHTSQIIVIVIAVLMICREFGVNVTPLLTGAGIIGVAVGFGAQSLIKDVLTGFFILMENQYRVGDVVKIAGLAGLVEKINLRTTVLRDLQGVVHVIPNGNISTVSNMTFTWSRCVLDIGVAYKEDLDHVTRILESEGEKMMNEPEWRKFIMEKPTVLGVEEFAESQITLRVLIKTVPLKQWDVARNFRGRVKKAFDREDIEIPFPQRTIWTGKEQS